MSEALELFLHSTGNRPQTIVAAVTETLRSVLSRLECLPGAGEHVFVGEAIIALEDPDAAEDHHQPVDIELTILELDLPHHRHIHTRAVHRVPVKVTYNGQHHERRFSPAATVGTVLAWAKKRFKIDAAAGANLVLELEPEKTFPTANQHLGELLQHGRHDLRFKLVAEVTPQG